MAAKDQQVDLQGALRGSVVPLSLKALKKKGVQRVKVIERDRLLKALTQAVEQRLSERGTAAPGDGAATPTEKKRIELLLIEIERLSKAKTQLEHDKGLVEAERSRLAAELERIAIEVSRGTGQKVKPEEVKNILEELERVREDRDKTRKALDRTLKEAERRIEAESERAKTAETSLAEARAALDAAAQEREQFIARVAGLEEKATKLAETEVELERVQGERDRAADRNLQLQRDVQRYRADYESVLREVEAAAPIVAAHREREAAEAAKAAEEAAKAAEETAKSAEARPEATPRSLPLGTAPAAPATSRAPKAAPTPRIPGFGFAGAESAPPKKGTAPRSW